MGLFYTDPSFENNCKLHKKGQKMAFEGQIEPYVALKFTVIPVFPSVIPVFPSVIPVFPSVISIFPSVISIFPSMIIVFYSIWPF